jgi:hypothetical protein
MKTLYLCALGLTVASCTRTPDVAVGGGFVTVADIPPAPIEDLDILFVIDNSGSMQPHQTALVESARSSLFAQLEAQMGGLPNLHVAVVSSDIGAGPYNISGCSGSGDNGRFQVEPRGPCTPPDGEFLIDIADGQGGRQTNYTETLADAFACIAPLGIDGCGFEQHLESMRRALDQTHVTHAGFLRPDAALLVVFVADEDDCSAFDGRMFDTSQTSMTSELGPLSSFRCFEFGAECDGDDPRTLGAKEGCVPRENSPFMTPISEYVQFLAGLKADPSLVMVAGIFGNPGPVTVVPDPWGAQGLTLANICPEDTPCVPPDASPPWPPDASAPFPDASVDAGPLDPDAAPPPMQCPRPSIVHPSPRLTAFAEAFPARYELESICDASQLAGPLARIAHTAGTVMSAKPCLLGPAPRLDTCRVFDVQAPRTAAETRTQVRACGAPGEVDCYVIEADAQCSGTETGLAVHVARSGSPPVGTHVVVECLRQATVD